MNRSKKSHKRTRERRIITLRTDINKETQTQRQKYNKHNNNNIEHTERNIELNKYQQHKLESIQDRQSYKTNKQII